MVGFVASPYVGTFFLHLRMFQFKEVLNHLQYECVVEFRFLTITMFIQFTPVVAVLYINQTSYLRRKQSF